MGLYYGKRNIRNRKNWKMQKTIEFDKENELGVNLKTVIKLVEELER